MTTAATDIGAAEDFTLYAEAFREVLGGAPRLVKLLDTDAHEGPVYAAAEDALYFTTRPAPGDDPLAGFPSVAVMRLGLRGGMGRLDPSQLSIVRASANMANGMTLDPAGRLLVCEQGTRAEHGRISRLDPVTGQVETVVDGFAGLRFNSPNDVVVKSDGTIWFTDPGYGYLQGFKPEPLLGDFVYRYDPASGRLSVVADGFDKPNGLAFSPDESVLYIGDSGAIQAPGSYHVNRPHHLRAFRVLGGRRLVDDRLFAVIAPGFPDGLKVDAAGRVYASSASGVQVFDPQGDLIGVIRVPGVVNFTFGGREGNVLLMTADTAIWAATLAATAPGWPPPRLESA